MDKSDVKKWMAQHLHSREWLADQCGVSKRTVGNWLTTTRPIPIKAKRVIKQLMDEDASREQSCYIAEQNLVLQFTPQDFDRLCEAASIEHKTPRKWAEDTLNHVAQTNPEAIAKDLLRIKKSAPQPPEEDKPA